MNTIKTPRERDIAKRKREVLTNLIYFMAGALFGAPILLSLMGGQT